MSGEERIRRIREFIGDYPLYKKLRVAELFEGDEQSLRSTLPEHLVQYEPIFLWCPTCGAERPFRRPEHTEGPAPFHRETAPASDPHRFEVYSTYLVCTGCFASEFRCWIEATPDWRTVQVDGTSSEKWLRKVGQIPPWDISVSRELEEALGDDAALYRRALICMSQSYGVGACTYMRRVLENRVAPLLEVFYGLKEEEGASAEELRGYRETIDGKVAEEKIRLANRIAPASIAVAGENALELIYDRLSAGIHRLDEQSCMRVAGEVRELLEYVFIRIESEREQRQVKRRYDDMVRALRDSPTG